MRQKILLGLSLFIMIAMLIGLGPLQAGATADQTAAAGVAQQDGTSSPAPLEGSPTATFLPTSTVSLTPSPSATTFELATPRPLQLTLTATPGTLDPNGFPIPTPMPTFEINRSFETINFLLIGHDSESDGQEGGGFRTDSMIILSVNRTSGTVAMLSLPRDLYVYAPSWQSQRLNVMWAHGMAVYGGYDGGFRIMRETILYNFGLQLHYYAVIDFSGFKEIIDTLGGVNIAVDCPIQDYRFTGEYDTNGDPTFELVTIEVGLHHMDSITALMYARSRRTSNDFDRGRRQQQLLRSVWAAARTGGWLTDVPTLYPLLTRVVETNIPLEVMLELAPLALSIQPTAVESHFFHTGRETMGYTTPSGAAVQLSTDKMRELIEAFLTPPTQNRLVAEGARIGIFDSSGSGRRWDAVAADRLIWEGLSPLPLGSATPPNNLSVAEESIIIDYTGETKGSSVDVLARILSIGQQDIYTIPDPNRTVDYAVYLSPHYNACYDRQIIQPTPQ